jgi:hypothetical protein
MRVSKGQWQQSIGNNWQLWRSKRNRGGDHVWLKACTGGSGCLGRGEEVDDRGGKGESTLSFCGHYASFLSEIHKHKIQDVNTLHALISTRSASEERW